MQLVKQRNSLDCGIAAAAMVSDRSYTEAYSVLRDPQYPLDEKYYKEEDYKTLKEQVPHPYLDGVFLGINELEAVWALDSLGVSTCLLINPNGVALRGTWISIAYKSLALPSTDDVCDMFLSNTGMIAVPTSAPGVQHWLAFSAGRIYDPHGDIRDVGTELCALWKSGGAQCVLFTQPRTSTLGYDVPAYLRRKFQ